MIITIDGPAGSGKSTTARAVADRLDVLYLDTGAMYRAVALAFARADADATPEAAAALVPDLRVDVAHAADGSMRVRLDGEDVTEAIRTPAVGAKASEISALRVVREKLVAEQRRVGRARAADTGGVVLDGRDTGTVVFPDADLKIFMTADLDTRARRRQAQYAEKGRDVPLDAVRAEVRNRDHRDRTRALGPLKKAPDAVVLDTTTRSFEEQVRFIVRHAREQADDATS